MLWCLVDWNIFLTTLIYLWGIARIFLITIIYLYGGHPTTLLYTHPCGALSSPPSCFGGPFSPLSCLCGRHLPSHWLVDILLTTFIYLWWLSSPPPSYCFGGHLYLSTTISKWWTSFIILNCCSHLSLLHYLPGGPSPLQCFSGVLSLSFIAWRSISHLQHLSGDPSLSSIVCQEAPLISSAYQEISLSPPSPGDLSLLQHLSGVTTFSSIVCQEMNLGSTSKVIFCVGNLYNIKWTVWVLFPQNVQCSASVVEHIYAFCLKIIPAAHGSEWQDWSLQRSLSFCCNKKFSVPDVSYSIILCNSSRM